MDIGYVGERGCGEIKCFGGGVWDFKRSLVVGIKCWYIVCIEIREYVGID